ncbi:MAG TPA: biotin/lipoate A/B protein ligase family protein [bacterium]|nr:biotin/lipoate A/B protein ligase family protein [bacterium]
MMAEAELELIETQTGAPSWNMALDEALLEEAVAGRQGPVLRFYRWEPSAVTLGYSQDAEREVDVAAAAAAGVGVVRRITGGGAVFHENEITYSIILPVTAVPGTIEDSYRRICGAMVRGLNFFRRGFVFSPVNDIIFDGKKVSGSAQARRGGWLLQHGTVLLDTDFDRMFGILRVPEGKFRKHGLESARSRVTCMKRVLGRELGFEEARRALCDGFDEDFGISGTERGVPENAKKVADKLVFRYDSDDWNFKRKKSDF